MSPATFTIEDAHGSVLMGDLHTTDAFAAAQKLANAHGAPVYVRSSDDGPEAAAVRVDPVQ